MSEPLYTARVSSLDGRRGKIESQTGGLIAELSMPEAMGGDGGHGTNPEELFAAGYAACFHSAIRFAARQAGQKLHTSSVTAAVSIERAPDGGFLLSARLEVELPGIENGLAKELVDEAHHRLCPYSRAVAGNIPVEIHIRTK